MSLIGVVLHLLAFALLLGALTLLWNALAGARADLRALSRHDKR